MTFPILLIALLGVFDGTHFGITWDDANGNARFALADPRPQAITSGIVLGHGIPQIAFDGSMYFVAWVDANGLEVQRLSRDGDLAGPPIRVAQHGTSPVITAIENGIGRMGGHPEGGVISTLPATGFGEFDVTVTSIRRSPFCAIGQTIRSGSSPTSRPGTARTGRRISPKPWSRNR